MKCAICTSKIHETFLEKIQGTLIKKKPVCNSCQSKLSIEEITEKIS